MTSDRSEIDAVRAWRKMPRAERRAAWRLANKTRGAVEVPDDILGGVVTRRAPRAPWRTLPVPSALQRHVLAGKAHPQSQKTRAISLGFNRDQRRAMVAKKGSRRMLTPVWGFPGAPGSVKSRPTSKWPGLWSKFAVRLEFNRRLLAHAEEYRRENTRFKRAVRWIVRLWRIVLKRLGR